MFIINLEMINGYLDGDTLTNLVKFCISNKYSIQINYKHLVNSGKIIYNVDINNIVLAFDCIILNKLISSGLDKWIE